MNASPDPRRRVVVTNARLFDPVTGRYRPGTTIVAEGDRFVAVTQEPVAVDDAAERIDAGGRVVLPGLIDAHVHVAATSHDLAAVSLQPASLTTAESARLMASMLRRGFTTVRDAAGADWGLQAAVERGLVEGPRLFISVQPISQTGGHADARPRGVRGPLFCACAGLGLAGAIADGVGEVRRAVREQVRQGANQIKIMAGGGVSSPSDPLEGTQFSMEELRAAVEEAEAANLYALAHAYSPRAVTRAVQAGVRSIEHGNLVDEASVREMKRAGVFFVPTLATYAALSDEGERLGWSAEMLHKLRQVASSGQQAVRLAASEGVPVVFGTDLLGHMHARQNSEFALRAPVQSALEILRGATLHAARLMRQEGRIGAVEPGAFADLLIVDGDPLADVQVLAEPERALALVMQGGRVVAPAAPGRS